MHSTDTAGCGDQHDVTLTDHGWSCTCGQGEDPIHVDPADAAHYTTAGAVRATVARAAANIHGAHFDVDVREVAA